MSLCLQRGDLLAEAGDVVAAILACVFLASERRNTLRKWLAVFMHDCLASPALSAYTTATHCKCEEIVRVGLPVRFLRYRTVLEDGLRGVRIHANALGLAAGRVDSKHLI